jgi:hypothetical protein
MQLEKLQGLYPKETASFDANDYTFQEMLRAADAHAAASGSLARVTSGHLALGFVF